LLDGQDNSWEEVNVDDEQTDVNDDFDNDNDDDDDNDIELEDCDEDEFSVVEKE